MAEMFGRNRVENWGINHNENYRNDNYRNMIDDPFLNEFGRNVSRNPLQRDFSNCCGFAASGEEISTTPPAVTEPLNTKVMNMQAVRYIKTALAIIGAYAVIKFMIGKFGKKAT
jgi:hypothetical protein